MVGFRLRKVIGELFKNKQYIVAGNRAECEILAWTLI